jgi:RNA polymerase sigma factor (sigma-70 family)
MIKGTKAMDKEAEVIKRIIKGEKELYEILMRKYNQRLYRIARSMVKSEVDVEDILQETYLKAFQHLNQFQQKSQFSTWIIRILINQANATLNKNKRYDGFTSLLGDVAIENNLQHSSSSDPEFLMSNNELKKILEEAIDKLSESLRCVYVMREVEGLSVAETSECLNISEENVKTRLHRAKTILKDELYKKTKNDIEIFRFGSDRCDRLVMSVMIQLGNLN